MTSEKAQALLDAYYHAVTESGAAEQAARQASLSAASMVRVASAMDQEIAAARRLIAAIIDAGEARFRVEPDEEKKNVESERGLYDAVLTLHEAIAHYEAAQQRLNDLVADFAAAHKALMTYRDESHLLPPIVGPSGDTWEVRKEGNRASIRTMPPAILIQE